MKKLFVITFILMSTLIYAEKNTDLRKQIRDLDYNISDMIVACQETLLYGGYRTSSIAWSATCRLLYHSPARFSVVLEKGQEYVFYTMTTGPGIRVCIERDGRFYKCASYQGPKIIYIFDSIWDGEVHYRIQPLTKKVGLHVSYFTKVDKEKK